MAPVTQCCSVTISNFPVGVTSIQVWSDFSSTTFFNPDTLSLEYLTSLYEILVVCAEGTEIPAFEYGGNTYTQSSATYDGAQYVYSINDTIVGNFTITFATDLTGTKWVFNSVPNCAPSSSYALNYTSNNTSYTSLITTGTSAGIYSQNALVYRYGSGRDDYSEVYTNSWDSQAYRLITITGGTDVQNIDLFFWLLSNATQVPVVDLTNTTWSFGSSVAIENSNQVQDYAINYSLEVEPNQYTPTILENGTSFKIETEDMSQWGVGNAKRAYRVKINTSYYDVFGDAIISYSGAIFATYTRVLSPTYPQTLSRTDNNSSTYVKKIMISNGTAVSNPDFIVWLTNNATIQESSSPEITIGTLSLSSVYCNGNITKIILNGVTLYEKIYYPITVTLTNATAASGNPSTIAQGGTATLVFTFDGTNYICPSTSPTVAGATGTWTKNSDSQGTMVLSNATGNVSFTVAGEQALPQLDTPTNLSVTDNVASFDEVENAEKYEFFVDDVSIGEYPSVSLISFTIGDISYQAEDGMTWGEWVASEYNTDNTDGYYIEDDYIVKNEQAIVGYVVCGPVLSSDVITENYNYVAYSDRECN